MFGHAAGGLLGAAPLDEVVEQLRGRVGHLDLEALDLVHEDVEKPDRRDRDEETEGRRDEGLRDPAGDRADSGRARCGHASECVDDPDDRSKEADEGSGRADRRETGKALFHVGRRDQGLALDGSLGRLDRIVTGGIRRPARDVVVELVEPRSHNSRQVAVLELLGGVDRLLQPVLLQELGYELRERKGLLLRLVVVDEPFHRDRQRVDRHQEKKNHDTLR
jgi:hypothetical protein